MLSLDSDFAMICFQVLERLQDKKLQVQNELSKIPGAPSTRDVFQLCRGFERAFAHTIEVKLQHYPIDAVVYMSSILLLVMSLFTQSGSVCTFGGVCEVVQMPPESMSQIALGAVLSPTASNAIA